MIQIPSTKNNPSFFSSIWVDRMTFFTNFFIKFSFTFKPAELITYSEIFVRITNKIFPIVMICIQLLTQGVQNRLTNFTRILKKIKIIGQILNYKKSSIKINVDVPVLAYILLFFGNNFLFLSWHHLS